MRVIRRFLEGDKIPDGATFLGTEQVKDKYPYRYETEVLYSTLLFGRKERVYAVYHLRTHYIYEVDEDEAT